MKNVMLEENCSLNILKNCWSDFSISMMCKLVYRTTKLSDTRTQYNENNFFNWNITFYTKKLNYIAPYKSEYFFTSNNVSKC